MRATNHWVSPFLKWSLTREGNALFIYWLWVFLTRLVCATSGESCAEGRLVSDSSLATPTAEFAVLAATATAGVAALRLAMAVSLLTMRAAEAGPVGLVVALDLASAGNACSEANCARETTLLMSKSKPMTSV
jgi:hypothetical protein